MIRNDFVIIFDYHMYSIICNYFCCRRKDTELRFPHRRYGGYPTGERKQRPFMKGKLEKFLKIQAILFRSHVSIEPEYTVRSNTLVVEAAGCFCFPEEEKIYPVGEAKRAFRREVRRPDCYDSFRA